MADTTELQVLSKHSKELALFHKLVNFCQMFSKLPINQAFKGRYRLYSCRCFSSGIICLLAFTATRKNNLYASLPDAEKSKVQDALKNMGVDVTLILQQEKSLCLLKIITVLGLASCSRVT